MGDISACKCNNVWGKSNWFYIPTIPRFRVLQIHVMLRKVSLDMVIWPHLVFSWIGGTEAIDKIPGCRK